MKTKYELEYTINTSPHVLFNRLSTAGGLCEWFADDVYVNGDIFTFIWEGTEQKARMTALKENKFVRFHWEDDDDPKSFFEFRINIDELTKDVALMVTDFAEDDEKDDAIDLWNTQIAELKRNLGL